MSSWNPLGKKPACLCVRPLLSQGLVTHVEDRELELAFVNLAELEDNAKKLYKEVQRYEDTVAQMHKLEHKMSSELLANSAHLCCCQDEDHAADHFRDLSSSYQKVVYQMGNNTEDLILLSGRTVVDPLKKLSAEFGPIANAIKKRDAALRWVNTCLLYTSPSPRDS